MKPAAERYTNEVEEVKRALLASGGAACELDVAIDGVGGNLLLVNFEHREIGRPRVLKDGDD